MTDAIRFRDLALGYGGRGSRPALEQLDGAIREGELLALLGPNGAGKSTLLRGILGLVSRLSGGVELPGRTVRDIAYLPQRPDVDRSFPLSVLEFAATGLWKRFGAFRGLRADDRRHVGSTLERVGRAKEAYRPLAELSGGQMQRALFARTILQDAPIILLDEPFTSIDHATAAELLAVVLGWHREGRTVVAALHDLAQVRTHVPCSLLLAGRPIAWGRTADVLTPAHLHRARGGIDELCSHGHAPAADETDAALLAAS